MKTVDVVSNSTASTTAAARAKGSSQNALKTGLFAHQLVVKTKFYEESASDFEQLRDSLLHTVGHPDGYAEALVDQAAFHLLCLKRANRFETALTKQSAESHFVYARRDSGVEKTDKELSEAMHELSNDKNNLAQLSKLPADLESFQGSSTMSREGALTLLMMIYLVEYPDTDMEKEFHRMRTTGTLADFQKKMGKELNPVLVDLKSRLQGNVNSLVNKIDLLRKQRKRSLREFQIRVKNDSCAWLLPSDEEIKRLRDFRSMHQLGFERMRSALEDYIGSTLPEKGAIRYLPESSHVEIESNSAPSISPQQIDK